MIQPTYYYLSDIKAAGGVLILEKLIKKSISTSLYRAALYINGKIYKVDVKLFKKGEGTITAIYQDGKYNSWEDLEDSFTNAIEKNTGNIKKIIRRRHRYMFLGYGEAALAFTLFLNYGNRFLASNQNVISLASSITALVAAILTICVTKRAIRQ